MLSRSDKKFNSPFFYPDILRNLPHKDRFEDGIFVFTKKILSWNLEKVKNPNFHLNSRMPLPKDFIHEEEYFDGFTDLILEEARAILHKGIESIEKIQPPAIRIELVEYKFGKNPQNPFQIYFRLKNQSDETIKSGDVVLLVYEELRLFGMATYVNAQEQDYQICLKVVVDPCARQAHYKAFATEDNRTPLFNGFANQGYRQYKPVWNMYPIGSLITHLRMYDACLSKIYFPFIEEVISGKLEQRPQKQEPFLKALEEKCNLNQSQQEAIKAFVCLEEGLQLVQGPPGTGKTTTLVELLNLSCDSSRILVSAPSNKAVQLLAERFLNVRPNVPVVFIGVEEKLPDNSSLNNVFIHTWKKQIIGMIKKLLNLVNSLQKPIITLKEKEIAPQTQAEETPQQLKKAIITPQKILEIKKTVEQLKIDFEKLINRLDFFKLDFSKEFMETRSLFSESLKEYQALFPQKSSNSGLFEPSGEWIERQYESSERLFQLSSRLQMKLYEETDDEIE